jgi:CDP-glucose 4,6-dehydratase
MLASNNPEICSAWNFGPDPAGTATVRDLVEEFLHAWGSGRWEPSDAPERLHEERSLQLSNERARAELGWRPRWNFEESVRRTAHWYKNFYAARSHSTRQLCLQDILDYESAAPNARDPRVSTLQQAGAR